MSYASAQGGKVNQEFVYTDAKFAEAYSDAKRSFFLRVGNTAFAEEVTLQVVVISETGVEYVGGEAIFTAGN